MMPKQRTKVSKFANYNFIVKDKTTHLDSKEDLASIHV